MKEVNYRAQGSESPEAVTYMTLPDKPGVADVWLAKNIHDETMDNEGVDETVYVWDETYARMKKTKTEVEANFEEYFLDPPEWTEPEPYTPPTIEERVQMNEDAIIELAELIGGMI